MGTPGGPNREPESRSGAGPRGTTAHRRDALYPRIIIEFKYILYFIFSVQIFFEFQE